MQPLLSSSRHILSEAALDEYIERARVDWRNVGLAVAIVANGDIAYAKGFGLRQFGHDAAVDRNTLFQVGSTTKAFTTAALGILVDEGKFQWDDLVVDHLPEFQLQDPWLTRNVTIRDTLTHRTGIRDSRHHPFLAVMDSHEAIRQLRYIPAEAPFRDSYRYSNLLYGVAGKIIEAATRVSWGEFVRRRLLEPLAMSRSGTSPYDFWEPGHVTASFLGVATHGVPCCLDARVPNVAMPHGWTEDDEVEVLPWQSYDNVAAAGALVSSVSDMAKWLVMHLNKGRFARQQLILQDTLQALHTVQNLRADRDQPAYFSATERYAMGWRRAEYYGHPHLGHGGGIIGFPAYMAIIPTRGAGVVVLSNGSQGARERLGLHKLGLHKAIAFWVFDKLLEMSPRDWSAEFLNEARRVGAAVLKTHQSLCERRLRGTAASRLLERYVGVYEDVSGPAPPVTIRLKGAELVLNFLGAGAYSANLEHWHHDLFRLRSNPGVADVLGTRLQFVSFEIGAGEAITSMTAFETSFRKVE